MLSTEPITNTNLLYIYKYKDNEGKRVMKFSIHRENLLQPITQVVGVVERRQTLPVLANFLVSARNGKLSITGTDMEVELKTAVDVQVD